MNEDPKKDEQSEEPVDQFSSDTKADLNLESEGPFGTPLKETPDM